MPIQNYSKIAALPKLIKEFCILAPDKRVFIHPNAFNVACLKGKRRVVTPILGHLLLIID